MRSPHHVRTMTTRLQREISHFESQLARYSNPATPQDRRNRTLAARCLRERQRDLAKLLGGSTDNQIT